MTLEAELADLHKKEAALVFTSGFMSNDAALGAIGRLLPNCLILSDEKNHASMIAGVRASGAEKCIFRHNDLDHLRQLLEQTERRRPKVIAFESIYSMDGDIAPIGADLRSRRRIRSPYLSRRGARGRSLRPARRRHRRARWRHGPRRYYRRDIGQRLWRGRWLYRRRCGDLRCDPLGGGKLYLHHGNAAGGGCCCCAKCRPFEEYRWRSGLRIGCRSRRRAKLCARQGFR